jgi:hypothetical protein
VKSLIAHVVEVEESSMGCFEITIELVNETNKSMYIEPGKLFYQRKDLTEKQVEFFRGLVQGEINLFKEV